MTKSWRFVVTVECDTEKQADQVMAERIYHDEDYGFDYSVDFESTHGFEVTLHN